MSKTSERANDLRDDLQVGDERAHLVLAALLGRAQDRRRMDRRDDVRRERRVDELPALPGDPEGRPDERLRRRRAEADHDLRAQDRELGVEPEPAGRDLTPVRHLVEAPLSGRTPLEMLHPVPHVDGLAIGPRFRERLVEDATSRSDEGAARAILLVPRLLADEDGTRPALALAEHGLRPGLPEVAGAAMGRGLAVRREARPLRELGVRVSGLWL